jgi:hypothetical protein
MDQFIKLIFCAIAFYICGWLSFLFVNHFWIFPFPSFSFWLVLRLSNKDFFDTNKKSWILFIFSCLAWVISLLATIACKTAGFFIGIDLHLLVASLIGALLIYPALLLLGQGKFKKTFIYFYFSAALLSGLIISFFYKDNSPEMNNAIGGIWQTIMGITITIGISTRIKS